MTAKSSEWADQKYNEAREACLYQLGIAHAESVHDNDCPVCSDCFKGALDAARQEGREEYALVPVLTARRLAVVVQQAQERQRGAYTEAMRQLIAIQPSGTKSGTNEDYIRIGYETALHKVSALIANAPLAGTEP